LRIWGVSLSWSDIRSGTTVLAQIVYNPPTDLAQLLLNFAEEMDRKPVNPDDLPSRSEAQEGLRRVKRRKGRRNLANFENLPVTAQVHELSAAEGACPCCGIERKEIGTDESWQVEYLPGHFERIHHVRKKYACAGCESSGNNPQMETALTLRNLSRDLGLGIAAMTIVRSSSKAVWRES
jgi:zinc-finger binding domain of transposase IS66